MGKKNNDITSGFTVISSNRLEILADRLAEIVRLPLSSPLEAEAIVVQSRGMERWVSMALAQRNKICANLWCPFPNAFLDALFRRILPELPEKSPFEREVLSFSILKILPTVLQRPIFFPLRRYLAHDDNGLKAFQLSVKLADLYDQYLIFRPEMIRQWEAGQGDDSTDGRWQAELWRALAEGKKEMHRAFLQQELLSRLDTTSTEAVRLPSRVSIFGVSYLPPFHLRSFVGLSRKVPVNLFLLSPCREYWADILTTSEMVRLSRRSGRQAEAGKDLHLEQGHPLLASMGRLGKEFFQLINRYDAHVEECFESVRGQGMLAQLQSDILDLRDRTDPTLRLSDTAVADSQVTLRAATKSNHADRSIQIHSCHSPMREVEVLRDNLLALFEEVPGLKPVDVIVMTPDIDAYAPYINAVFDSQGEDGPVIPFHIADQNPGKLSPIALTFLSLLDLPNSRFGARRVLGLLNSAGIRERFRMTPSDIDTISRWVSAVNIRWGRHANSSERKGMSGYPENTWQAGIDRLLLGYAMPGREQTLFSGILPYDHIEGAEAQLLGRFLEFLDRLFDLSSRLERVYSPAEWQSVLADMLGNFFAENEDTDREVQHLHSYLESLGRAERLDDFSDPLTLDVVRAYLENHISAAYGESGFLSGGITFCAMLPMRSIPFTVVCLIGMNDTAFPRDNHSLGFDLIARHPRPGDRSRRKDDKYLFLEALVSARRFFYLSYVGQSVQDNSRLPPSVLVSELIETLAKSFGQTENDLVVQHPLQAYSRRYFEKTDPQLFSYSRDNFAAAAGGNDSMAPKPFFTKDLSEPPAEMDTLQLAHFCQFYAHPVRYLAKKRLRIQLEEPEQPLVDRENFSLNALDRYHLKQGLLSARLSGHDRRRRFLVEKAKGNLPLGTVGEVVYGQLDQDTELFTERLYDIIGAEPAESIPLDMTLGRYRLLGALDSVYPESRVQARFAARKAKDWLSVWICHLVLCAQTERSGPDISMLVDTDGAVRLRPVSRPEEALVDLLEIYRKGLRRPLRFFPDLSFRFFTMVAVDGKDPKNALSWVRKRWAGTEYQKGVADDPYYKLCIGGDDPFDEEFTLLAERIFSPLQKHAEVLN